MSRGKSPSEFTIRRLIANCAGNCEYPGCKERLFWDNVSNKEFNNSYIAHIIASNPNGPRGDKQLSHKLSAELSNLMLMCGTHHKLIDTQVETFPVRTLQKMKKDYEAKVERVLNALNKHETNIVTFKAKIKNQIDVYIEYKKVVDAVLNSYCPHDEYGISLDINSSFDYKTDNYWIDVKKQIDDFYKTSIVSIINRNPASHFSIFSIAPIPLLIYFGYLIGDKNTYDVFQYFRETESWQWLSDHQTNEFHFQEEKRKDGEKIALLLELSSPIKIEDISNYSKYKKILRIEAKEQNVNCIKSEKDLLCFWTLYQDVLNKVSRNKSDIDLFPAIPTSTAIEIGRRYMPNVYPKINVFDNCDGFRKTLVIGE